MTDFKDLQDVPTKEKIMYEFFTWLFDDSNIQNKSVSLISEIDLSLAHDYMDPNIYFPEPIYRFFETPAMKRLGRVSQLSFSVNEFPNTYHHRLEHSKGVYNRKVEEMLYNYKLPEWKKYIEDNNLKLYLIAELIKIAGHDIGHFPFSHAMEEQLFGYHGVHEVIGQRLMLENKDIQDVLISISPSLPSILQELYKQDFLNFKIHDDSSYDVDRVDYISRDSLYVGSPVNIRTLPYKSFPSFSHTQPFVDAYSDDAVKDIEKLFNIREYGYDHLYMSEQEQASECVMSVFFREFLKTDSNSGISLRNYLNSFTTKNPYDIDLNEFIKWDDIAVYRELFDIAENHKDKNIRKLAILMIPRITSFLNLLYSLLDCKKSKNFAKEDTDFLLHLKSLIRENAELISDLSSPNFMNENIISLHSSPILNKLKKQGLVSTFDYTFKAYNPSEPVYALCTDGTLSELSQHPSKTRDWKNSTKILHYDFTYVPLLKIYGVPDETINQIKSASTLEKKIIPPKNVNMSLLQTDHTMKDYFLNLEIDEK